MAFKLDGNTLAVGRPFTANGVNYPRNWLSLSTLDEKKAIGITEVADPKVYNQKFYNFNGSEKDVTDLKKKFIEEDKNQAKGRLALTDWYIIRKAELGTAIPSDITTKRNAIKTACTTREAEINACDTHAKLVTLYGNDSDGKPNMTQWPSEDN